MTDLQIKAKELYESIDYKYFRMIEGSIEFYSIKKDEDKRLRLGRLYNALSGVKYKIMNVDLNREDALSELESLKKQFQQIISAYKTLINKKKLGNVTYGY